MNNPVLTSEKAKEHIVSSEYKLSTKKKLQYASAEFKKLLPYELVPVFNNKADGFVLIYNDETNDYVPVRFESSKLKASKLTGRQRAVICDLCFTWRKGSGISRISFYPPQKDQKGIGLLCCSKLDCSLHVRSLTEESTLSRAQFKEDMNEQEKISRLKTKCMSLIIDHLKIMGHQEQNEYDSRAQAQKPLAL